MCGHSKYTTGRGSSDPFASLKQRMLDARNNNPDRIRARILREQWEDYKQRFQPLEDRLLDMAGNPDKYFKERREQAMGRLESGYENLPGLNERRLGAYGLKMDESQKAHFDKQMGLQKTLDTVGVENRLRDEEEEVQNQIVGGGLMTRPMMGG